MSSLAFVRNTPIDSRFKWRWFIAPGCYFYVKAAPNRFHRFMQRILIGVHWEPVNDATTAQRLIEESLA